MRANVLNSKAREEIRKLAREETVRAQHQASSRAMAMTVLAFYQAGARKALFAKALEELVPIMERFKMYKEYGVGDDGLCEALRGIGIDPAAFGLEEGGTKSEP